MDAEIGKGGLMCSAKPSTMLRMCMHVRGWVGRWVGVWVGGWMGGGAGAPVRCLRNGAWKEIRTCRSSSFLVAGRRAQLELGPRERREAEIVVFFVREVVVDPAALDYLDRAALP
jgi:hypothetical protein